MKTVRAIASRVLGEKALLRLEVLDHLWRGEPELRLVNRLCAPDKVAVDVGANIGIYTYLMSRHARHVVAYEPNPMLARRLRALFPRADIRNAAVSSRAGVVRLGMPVQNGRPLHELASIADTFEDSAEREVFDVDAVTLDGERLGNVGFLKVDVERHEREALGGALEMIRRCRPIVMTEVTPLLYERGLVETFRFLTDLGYRGWFRFGRPWAPFDRFDASVHANSKMFGTERFMSQNVIFLPEEISGETLLAV